SLTTGHLAGVEALVRWPHPDRGLLLPDSFLPVARDNGLMGALTELVLSRACRDAARWRTAGREIAFAVNLFPPSLTDPDLVPQILDVLGQHGLRGDSLTVEITEEIRLNNLTKTRSVLKVLQDNGVRIALDDFGSGYSSLSYLGELGVDELKFDRAFVAPILHSPSAQVIVRSAVTMAHTLGMTCVAEGVDNADTVRMLSLYGCDMVQGNYCSPPVSAAEILLLPPLNLLGTATLSRHGVS
ncbi:MAG: diguanylate cyclase protein, partial [Mycobacterium sp.]|nr:diguanylate cyclase protein [Mycobacterium sp.]